MHVLVPSICELLKLSPLNRLDLKKLVPLLDLHTVHLSLKLVVGELLKLFRCSLCFNVVHFLLGLFQVVLEKLQKLDSSAFGCAADSFFGSELAKLLHISYLFYECKSFNIGGGLGHLGCDLGVFLSHLLRDVFVDTLLPLVGL